MTDLPRWYRPLTIAAVAWNLLGVAAWLSDVTTSAASVATMSAADRAMYEARPAWFVAAYSVAVWGGTLGALGLVLRRRWTTPLLWLSLAGLLAQDAALLSRPEVRAAPVVLGLQGLVLAIAAGLLGIAGRARTRGWLRA